MPVDWAMCGSSDGAGAAKIASTSVQGATMDLRCKRFDQPRRSPGVPSTAFILPALLLLACAACADAPAAGPWKPTRTVEFVVAAGPGGGSDQFARAVQSIIGKHRL